MKTKIIFFGCLITFVSCHSNHDEDNDPTAPTITILSPNSSLIAKNNDTIRLLANVVDNRLHEVSFEIVGQQNDTFISKILDEHDKTNFNVISFWNPKGFNQSTSLSFIVHSEDQNAHKVTNQVAFTVIP
ncbi:MAG: hypothetical protein ABIO44_11425 [Saprospiraceae bacterium]